MVLDFDLATDTETRTDQSAPPPNDALLAALLELARSAERNQAPDRREDEGEGETEAHE